MKLKNLFVLAVFAFVLSNCSNDDEAVPLPKGDFENGILVSHEGNSNISGTTSFVSDDLGTIQDNIYNTINGDDLGIYQQSIGFNQDYAFIVVDNANTITVVNRYTFEKIGAITSGLNKPRYITFYNNKAYVTNWGDTASSTDDFVAVVNLKDLVVESKTISVSLGPERIVEKNGKLYVSHKGAFGSNNILTVIDGNDHTTKEIEVGDNPDELVFDASGDLWVLCGGKTVYDSNYQVVEKTPGALVKIDTDKNSIDRRINFEGEDQPGLMSYEAGKIYYSLNSAIYAIDDTSTSLSTSPIVSGSFYGMEVYKNKLYTLDAVDFSSKGVMKVFDLKTNEEIKSVSVGVIPSKIYFND